MSALDPPDIAREDPDQPEIRVLLSASDAYMAKLYPAESNHLLDVECLKSTQVTFLVARLDGQAVGCGALVRSTEEWAEIKRMFVLPDARGRNLGRLLLQSLTAIAAEHDIAVLRLETGIKQPEALALYRSAGFVEIGPFGQYRLDPHSVFMEKRIILPQGQTRATNLPRS
jgi:putative acetyltransferase